MLILTIIIELYKFCSSNLGCMELYDEALNKLRLWLHSVQSRCCKLTKWRLESTHDQHKDGIVG